MNAHEDYSCAGAAGVGLLPYTLTSALAIIPWCVTFTYFGTAARSMADILDGRAGPNGAMTAVFLSLSAVTLVSAIVFSTVIARCAPLETLVPLHAHFTAALPCWVCLGKA